MCSGQPVCAWEWLVSSSRYLYMIWRDTRVHATNICLRSRRQFIVFFSVSIFYIYFLFFFYFVSRFCLRCRFYLSDDFFLSRSLSVYIFLNDCDMKNITVLVCTYLLYIYLYMCIANKYTSYNVYICKIFYYQVIRWWGMQFLFRFLNGKFQWWIQDKNSR